MVTLTLVFMVPIFAVMLPFMALLMLLGPFSMTAGWGISWDVFQYILWGTMGVFLLAVVVVAGLSAAMHALYQTALYEYARTGKVRRPYSKATLVDAWTPYQT